jgi:ankyrin repeat protein
MADNTSKKEESFDARALAAVESNDITFLQNLLNQRLAEDPNAFLPYGNLGSSLGRALELSRYDMADELFMRGAEWNYGTMADVLEGAREDNEWNTKAIDIALAHGWNIDEHYEHVGSALVYTVSESDSGPDYPSGDTVCLKMAAYLLSKGAAVDEGAQTGDNPLELACSLGDKHMAALLLAHNATMEKAPKALLNAAGNGDIEIMQMLLDHGANVNAHPYGTYTTLPQQRESESWGSALHCAIGKGHTEAVRFLLEKGAAQEYKNKLDMTALDLAKKLGNDEIVRLLQ